MKRMLVAILVVLLLVVPSQARERTWQEIQGGRVTDGLSLIGFDLESVENGLDVVLTFDDEPGWYRVEYYTHPFSLILSLSGVRFVETTLPQGQYIAASVSPLITLDDSMYRFYIELQRPAYVSVRTGQDNITVSLRETPYDALDWNPRYSVRTGFLEGESLGMAEEILGQHSFFPARVIRSKDQYVVEAGLYATISEAEAAYQRLRSLGVDLDLVVEERSTSQRPQLTASRFSPWKLETMIVERDSMELHVDAHIPLLVNLPDHAPLAQWNGRITQYLMDRIAAIEQDARELRDDINTQDWPFWPFVFSSRFHPTRNDEEWVSFTTESYQYTGGAHGITVKKGWNFHVPSGTQPKFGDLFPSDSGYQEIVAEEITRQIQQRPDDFFQDNLAPQRLGADQDYYLTDKGIVVFFPVYELAPYVIGIPEFFIPYEQVPTIKVGD